MYELSLPFVLNLEVLLMVYFAIFSAEVLLGFDQFIVESKPKALHET